MAEAAAHNSERVSDTKLDRLIQLGARMGLLDEREARRAAAEGRPASVRELVGSGLVKQENASKLLNEYHRQVAREITRDPFQPALCGNCSTVLTKTADKIACDTCGIVVAKKRPRPAAGAVPAEAAAAARDPKNLFGKYVRIRKIGAGGFGAVWLGWDRALSRNVAMKFLSGQMEGHLDRFRREARTAAALSHPNIVPVYDVGRLDEQHFIVMEYVPGKPAHQAELSPEQAVEVVRQSALGVHHAHKKGVVHRDLKPHNIMVVGRERPKAMVMDFGMAKSQAPHASMTVTGEVVGTPAFMAPEQARGEVKRVDARSDVWALGATLYYLLTGHGPFEGESDEVYEQLKRVIEEEPRPPRAWSAGIGEDVETIVLKCLEKDPERRYVSARALAEDLKRAQAGEPIEARPASGWYRLRRRLAKRKALVTTAAAGLVAVAGVAAWLGPQLWRAQHAGAQAEVRAESAEEEARRRREEAIEQMRRAARTNLEAALELRRAGAPVASQQKFLAGVVEACGRAIERDPKNPEPRWQLGVMHRALQRTDEALEEQEKALGIDGGYAPALYERAVLSCLKFEEVRLKAEKEWERSGTEGPRSAPTMEALERAAPELGKLRERIEADLTAIGANPGPLGPARLESARGHLAWARKDWTSAVATLQRARESDPLLEEVWRAEGRSLSMQKRYDEAAQVYTQALAHDKGFTPFLFGRSWARRQLKDYDGAIADLERVLQLDPGKVAAHLQIGQAYGLKGDMDAAIGALERFLKEKPDHAEALRDLAYARATKAEGLARAGKADEARAEFDRALANAERSVESAPQEPMGFFRRGWTRARFLELIGDLLSHEACLDLTSKIIADYEKAVALGFDEAPPYQNSGITFTRVGEIFLEAARPSEALEKLKLAISNLTKAMELNEDDADIRYAKGNAHHAAARALRILGLGGETRDELKAAIKEFSQAVSLKPDYSDAWNNLGLACVRLGEVLSASGERGEAIRAVQEGRRAYDRAAAGGHALATSNIAAIRIHEAFKQARAGEPNAAVQMDEALNKLREIIAYTPQSADLHSSFASGLGVRATLEYASARHEQSVQLLNQAWAEAELAHRLKPRSPIGFATRGTTQLLRGTVLGNIGREDEALAQWKQAIPDFEQAIKGDPTNSYALNGLAWILATCPDGALRDGERALRLAGEACRLSPESPDFLDTMAAALAESGKMEEALQTQQEVLEKLPKEAHDRHEFMKRLKVYQNGKPFREWGQEVVVP
jgi:serine/threonine-protein kinase